MFTGDVMRKAVSAAVGLVLMGLASVAGAQIVTPTARLPLQDGFDLPGGDLGPIFNINQAACVQACLSNDACTAVT